MEFKAEKQKDVSIIHVYLTRATLAKAVKFKEFATDIINEGINKIIIDLTLCEYIDSTFLGALVSLLKKVNALGGDIRLVYNKEAPSLMFMITRMDKVFKIFSTLDEALISFGITPQKPKLEWK
ncbi:STAS domain-containing protein [Rosettibacter firmus]|uniref:STAS domain-containing protein n=1 Tax=Rosettibacter firmus TaxID=3111522 RepID=UPI00336BD4B3